MNPSPLLLFSLIFIFGTIIGSFLNVLIYRLGSGFGFNGRSQCLSCGKILRARMLVPVLSYLVQGGRCAYCRTKLSVQYPLVEVATGLLFLAAAWVNHLNHFPFPAHSLTFFFLDLSVLSTLVVIAVYDIKHKIIPDQLSLCFALLGGVILATKFTFGLSPEHYIPVFDQVPWWIDIAAAPLLAVPLALLWLLSGGRAMGLGDAKLAWGMGWFLGFSKGISAIVFAFWIAFIPSMILLFLPRKHFTMKSEIPFAPFLVLGTLAAYVSGINILNWTF